jgi:PDZ domain/Secretion system C-terminal sorting domain
MKKSLLSLITLTSLAFSSQAQDLSNCKNPCDKTTIVESGPFIGVRIITSPSQKHAQVIEVLPNTSAEKNRMAINDVITSFEGVEVLNNQHLIGLVATHKPGDLVSITYTHEGRNINKQIVLGAQFSKEVVVKGCCDGIGELPSILTVALTPNPAVDNLTITSSAEMNGAIEIRLIDLKGQVIKTISTENKGLFSYPIDLSNMINGQYLLRVTNGDNIFVEKFVIMK